MLHHSVIATPVANTRHHPLAYYLHFTLQVSSLATRKLSKCRRSTLYSLIHIYLLV